MNASLLLRLLSIGTAVVVSATSHAGEVLEEVVEKDYPVDFGAKFTLQNDDGSVLIYGANVAQMKLQAIKKAYTKDRLSKISVDVVVRPGTVAVRTGYPPKPKWGLSDRSGTVDYVIILPWLCDVTRVDLGNGEMLIDGMRGREVRAQLGNGRLFGRNCFTDLNLSIGTGGVEVTYDWWEKDFIALNTTIRQGITQVIIPSAAQAQLHAETANGYIFNDFDQQENQRFQQRGKAKADLLVGKGSPNAEVQLHALEGNINIKEFNP